MSGGIKSHEGTDAVRKGRNAASNEKRRTTHLLVQSAGGPTILPVSKDINLVIHNIQKVKLVQVSFSPLQINVHTQ